MNRQPTDPRHLSARASKVVLAAVLVTAVSGYFMGLHQTKASRADAERRAEASRSPSPVATAAAADVAVPEAVEYARLGEVAWKPNANWRSRLDQLRPAGGTAMAVAAASTGASAMPATEEERREALRLRAERRAFEGAPPVIPHPVDASPPDNCRACHQHGMSVRGVVARRMSHGELGSCIQCHVPRSGPAPVLAQAPGLPAFEDNLFVGAGAAGRGSRAWPGAPPTIPHTLWMRQECASCHGAGGLEGLRTSHPERPLCQQCHVPESGTETLPWFRDEVALNAASSAAVREALR